MKATIQKITVSTDVTRSGFLESLSIIEPLFSTQLVHGPFLQKYVSTPFPVTVISLNRPCRAAYIRPLTFSTP